MTIRLEMTSAELRMAYGVIRSALNSGAARRDPESLPLRTLLAKMRREANNAFCGECGDPSVYAKGKCEPCYRSERRKAG